MAVGQVVIENPIINSPFEEPKRHFRFGDDGITNEIVEQRRVSSYFIPVAQPKKRGKQLVLDTEWTKDRIEENKFINDVRARVALWRQGGYPGITKTSSRLLEYWQNPDRERKLFFCQIEALETIIYITEAAKKYGDAWIENALRDANDSSNPGLYRLAMKMATGSGKTVVMAMLIAWHALNKLANTQDPHFSDTFLIVTPGITNRDRLRVLLPNDPDNYYAKMDIVAPELRGELNQAKFVITNFHAFKRRETQKANKTTKRYLAIPTMVSSPRRPIRWSAASAANWATRRISWSSGLFPQVLEITRDWLDQGLACKDNTFPQMLLLVELAHDAADRIYKSIVSAAGGDKRLLPILRPYDTVGSTQYVSFDTTRPVYATDPKKCHISHVVADTESWEQKMAQTLEEMDEVVHYVKNQNRARQRWSWS
jgi:hypothetical protein